MRRRTMIATVGLGCTALVLLGNIEQPSPLTFVVGGRTAFVTRQLNPAPDGATDFRILGTPRAPAILSLIGSDEHRYADYTYNGSDADVDISNGGLNLRPLDGMSSVNVWSMTGNTQLKVGNKDFREAVSLWHDGVQGYVQSSTGGLVVKSKLQVEAGLRARLNTPVSSTSACLPGEMVWDAKYIYVCTATDTWKRASLGAY